MKLKIPSYIRPFLWSYDLNKIDLEKDKKRIITNILNYGTQEAVSWLFSIYPRGDIVAFVKNPLPGEWNDKSLNFWSFIFDVTPKILRRKI